MTNCVQNKNVCECVDYSSHLKVCNGVLYLLLLQSHICNCYVPRFAAVNIKFSRMSIPSPAILGPNIVLTTSPVLRSQMFTFFIEIIYVHIPSTSNYDVGLINFILDTEESVIMSTFVPCHTFQLLCDFFRLFIINSHDVIFSSSSKANSFRMIIHC